MKKITLFIFLFIFNTSFSQEIKINCSRIKQSKLHLLSSGNIDSYIEINNDKHTEYLDEFGNYVKSNLIWISDCEYIAIITEINVSDVPFTIGDKLNVKIVNISNNIVDMICVFKGETLNVQYEIIEFL